MAGSKFKRARVTKIPEDYLYSIEWAYVNLYMFGEHQARYIYTLFDFSAASIKWYVDSLDVKQIQDLRKRPMPLLVEEAIANKN